MPWFFEGLLWFGKDIGNRTVNVWIAGMNFGGNLLIDPTLIGGAGMVTFGGFSIFTGGTVTVLGLGTGPAAPIVSGAGVLMISGGVVSIYYGGKLLYQAAQGTVSDLILIYDAATGKPIDISSKSDYQSPFTN